MLDDNWTLKKNQQVKQWLDKDKVERQELSHQLAKAKVVKVKVVRVKAGKPKDKAKAVKVEAIQEVEVVVQELELANHNSQPSR